MATQFISLTCVAGNNLKYRPANLIICASCSVSSPTVWLCSIFRNYLVTAIFSENLCFDFLQNSYLKHFSFQEEIGEVSLWKPLGLHVNSAILFFDFTTDVSSTDFNKISRNYVLFRVVACGRMDWQWTNGIRNWNFENRVLQVVTL